MSNFLSKVAPFIAAAATGGVPALVAIAAKTVGDALGEKIEPTPEAIDKAVSSASPEQLILLQESERNFKVEMEKLGLDREALYIKDTQDARLSFAKDNNVFYLGVVILVAFSLGMIFSMWGAYELLSGGILIQDNGTVAAVFGFLGTIVGYLSANAQQVVSYFFGSSAGSKQKTDTLADAVASMGKK
jgi:hypothetical protein